MLNLQELDGGRKWQNKDVTSNSSYNFVNRIIDSYFKMAFGNDEKCAGNDEFHEDHSKWITIWMRENKKK